MYESAITRIGDRPGTSIQDWLARRIVRRFLKFGKQHDVSVLEIGTGVGRVASQVLARGHSYVGIEPTQSLRLAAVERMTTQYSKGRVFDSRLPSLHGLTESGFTHVIAVHVLEHAEGSKSAFEWLSAMAEKTASGGVLLIICPNILDFRGYFFDSDWTHGWESTSSRIASMGEDVGLEVLEEMNMRAGFSNPIIKFPLALAGKIFPTDLLNYVSLKSFGLRNFGTGIQTALFWRTCWVVFKKN